jgi:Fe-S-cluster containining protein
MAKKEIKITAENKCSFCKGSICCTYVTQQIDTPKTMKDFDFILWQLSHRDMQLYKDEDGWFLIFNQQCRHLMPGGGCSIYERRPRVCREYDNDFCEYDMSAEKGFKLFFKDDEALDTYCRKRFKKWDKRFSKWGFK